MEIITNLIKEAINKIENAKSKRNPFAGVPSGLMELDRKTVGWQKSELVVIAAHPIMDKMAFALTIARNAAIDFNKTVAIFSSDLTSVELATKLISFETETSLNRFINGTLEDFEFKQINNKVAKLAKAPLFIEDAIDLSISEIRNKILKLNEKQYLDLIIIENLHEIRDELPVKQTKTQEISSITIALKALALELNVPVIVFSNLTSSEHRQKNYRPVKNDLPQHEAIFRNATNVMFLHRPEYNNIDFDENKLSTKGMVELIIEKLNDELCSKNIVKLKYDENVISYYSDYSDL